MNTFPIRLQNFRWTEKDGTEHLWSVDMALALIKTTGLKPEVEIDRELALDALAKNDQANELLPEHVERAVLDEPLIIVEHSYKGQRMHVIIDGWHRINKFVNRSTRMEPLMAYYLTEDEAKRIKLK